MSLTQTQKLYLFFKEGGRIADHESYQVLGFPNLRSRVCNVEKQFGVKVHRERVKGKNYNQYWMEQQLTIFK